MCRIISLRNFERPLERNIGFWEIYIHHQIIFGISNDAKCNGQIIAFSILLLYTHVFVVYENSFFYFYWKYVAITNNLTIVSLLIKRTDVIKIVKKKNVIKIVVWHILLIYSSMLLYFSKRINNKKQAVIFLQHKKKQLNYS